MQDSDTDTLRSFLIPRLQDKSDPHSDQTKFYGLLPLTIAGVLGLKLYCIGVPKGQIMTKSKS